jgi:hypothetical protein
MTNPIAIPHRFYGPGMQEFRYFSAESPVNITHREELPSTFNTNVLSSLTWVTNLVSLFTGKEVSQLHTIKFPSQATSLEKCACLLSASIIPVT